MKMKSTATLENNKKHYTLQMACMHCTELYCTVLYFNAPFQIVFQQTTKQTVEKYLLSISPKIYLNPARVLQARRWQKVAS